MFAHLRLLIAAGLALMLVGAANGQTVDTSRHMVFTVRLDAGVEKPVSGRLILVAVPRAASALRDDRQALFIQSARGLRPNPAPGSNSAVSARRNVRLAPGQTLEIDADEFARPGFSALPPGRYFFQAILDADDDFAYAQRPTPGDAVSDLAIINLPTDRPVLSLKTVAAQDSGWDLAPPEQSQQSLPRSESALAAARKRYADVQAVKASTERIFFRSAVMTAFQGRPTDIKAYILTPPGYRTGSARYPVVFRTEGFGGAFDRNFGIVQQTHEDMVAGKSPPMIWVFLDHSGPTGTHEFADSVNNGPWGKALTEEFIPWLDARYRTDGKASGRFTTGHSSGGWAALWLQVRYPKLFGGTWPIAPDPVDFRSFTNIDIYAPGANAYRRADGSPTPLVRDALAPVTFQQYAQLERVMGDYGGQIDSFDWVFSPRGRDGRPQPLFDRFSGEVDPQVALYWRDNYDIAYRIRRDWRTLKPDLDGKIHLWVGTLDTYHLEIPARLLKGVLDDLGARSEFHFVEGANHGTILGDNSDQFALEKALAWAMYAKARPNSKLTPAP